MAEHLFALSPWSADQAATLEAWGSDRQSALQATLNAAVALMVGEDAIVDADPGPLIPLRAEGESLGELVADLLDDLVAQVETHGPVQGGALDGVLKRDRGGYVAWGYLSPHSSQTLPATFERLGAVDVLREEPEEIRVRATLRRVSSGGVR